MKRCKACNREISKSVKFKGHDYCNWKCIRSINKQLKEFRL